MGFLGFGGSSSSKSVSETSFKSSASVLARSLMQCDSSSINLQKIDIQASNTELTDINMKQVSKLDISCFQEADRMASLQADVLNHLENSAKAKGSTLQAIMGTKSNASAITKAKTEIAQAVTFEAVLEISNNSVNEQSIILGKDATGAKLSKISMDQSMEIITNNSQKVIDKIDTAQKVDSFVGTKATAEGGDLLGGSSSIFGAIGGIFTSILGIIGSIFGDPLSFVFFVIVVMLSLGVVTRLYKAYNSKQKKPQQQQRPQQQQPQQQPQQQLQNAAASAAASPLGSAAISAATSAAASSLGSAAISALSSTPIVDMARSVAATHMNPQAPIMSPPQM